MKDYDRFKPCTCPLSKKKRRKRIKRAPGFTSKLKSPCLSKGQIQKRGEEKKQKPRMPEKDRA